MRELLHKLQRSNNIRQVKNILEDFLTSHSIDSNNNNFDLQNSGIKDVIKNAFSKIKDNFNAWLVIYKIKRKYQKDLTKLETDLLNLISKEIPNNAFYEHIAKIFFTRCGVGEKENNLRALIILIDKGYHDSDISKVPSRNEEDKKRSYQKQIKLQLQEIVDHMYADFGDEIDYEQTAEDLLWLAESINNYYANFLKDHWKKLESSDNSESNDKNVLAMPDSNSSKEKEFFWKDTWLSRLLDAENISQIIENIHPLVVGKRASLGGFKNLLEVLKAKEFQTNYGWHFAFKLEAFKKIFDDERFIPTLKKCILEKHPDSPKLEEKIAAYKAILDEISEKHIKIMSKADQGVNKNNLEVRVDQVKLQIRTGFESYKEVLTNLAILKRTLITSQKILQEKLEIKAKIMSVSLDFIPVENRVLSSDEQKLIELHKLISSHTDYIKTIDSTISKLKSAGSLDETDGKNLVTVHKNFETTVNNSKDKLRDKNIIFRGFQRLMDSIRRMGLGLSKSQTTGNPFLSTKGTIDYVSKNVFMVFNNTNGKIRFNGEPNQENLDRPSVSR